MKLTLIFLAALLGHSTQSLAAPYGNSISSHMQSRLAVSQGISAPATTTPVNFSHGFMETNAAVAATFNRPHISLEGDIEDPTHLGGELGVGSGYAGVGLGYYKPTCSGCDGAFGGMAGLSSNYFAGGLGYHEDSVYSAGAIFNPRGMHRFGVVADFHGGYQGIYGIGVGYSYNAPNVVFALDASRRGSKYKSDGDSAIMLTPGLKASSGIFVASISYDAYFNGDLGNYRNRVWGGIAVGKDRFNVALYYDYVNDWSLAATFWL